MVVGAIEVGHVGHSLDDDAIMRHEWKVAKLGAMHYEDDAGLGY